MPPHRLDSCKSLKCTRDPGSWQCATKLFDELDNHVFKLRLRIQNSLKLRENREPGGEWADYMDDQHEITKQAKHVQDLAHAIIVQFGA